MRKKTLDIESHTNMRFRTSLSPSGGKFTQSITISEKAEMKKLFHGLMRNES